MTIQVTISDEYRWYQAEHEWKQATLPNWEGHPWRTTEHRTVGYHRAWCECGTWCYPSNGCFCCNEPAYEWGIAEARWWAERARDISWPMSLDPEHFTSRLPWETE